MMSCHNGHTDIVKLLLEHSDPQIDFNAKDNDGQTAFMWACRKGHKDVVKLLLEHSNQRIEVKCCMNCKQDQEDIVQLLLDYSHIEIIDVSSHDDCLFQ